MEWNHPNTIVLLYGVHLTVDNILESCQLFDLGNFGSNVYISVNDPNQLTEENECKLS